MFSNINMLKRWKTNVATANEQRERKVEILKSYVPQVVARHALDRGQSVEPSEERMNGVILFADVSGFSRMAEEFHNTGAGLSRSQMADMASAGAESVRE